MDSSDPPTVHARTPLHQLHLERGGRLVPFAGYEMPLRYDAGPIAEHNQARRAAALFDVSHMGIVQLRGPGAAAALETLVPSAIATLGPGRLRYTLFTNEAGGVIDDLMVTAEGPDALTLVVNASGRFADVDHLRAGLPADIEVNRRDDLALLALQGPAAVAVLRGHDAAVDGLTFLQAGTIRLGGASVAVSRSGYTGDDGFELALAAEDAVAVAEALLAHPDVALAGLAARDSLRLEAGLCLYGHDLDEGTSPVEAGLAWTIQARRRETGGFPGAARILAELADGPARRRVGIVPLGRKPIRDGAPLLSTAGDPVGSVTSGGYGPTFGGPLAMGYVDAAHAAEGTELSADVRGTPVPCRVSALPFVPHRYHRG